MHYPLAKRDRTRVGANEVSDRRDDRCLDTGHPLAGLDHMKSDSGFSLVSPSGAKPVNLYRHSHLTDRQCAPHRRYLSGQPFSVRRCLFRVL